MRDDVHMAHWRSLRHNYLLGVFIGCHGILYYTQPYSRLKPQRIFVIFVSTLPGAAIGAASRCMRSRCPACARCSDRWCRTA